MQGNVRERRRRGRLKKTKTEGNFYQGLDEMNFAGFLRAVENREGQKCLHARIAAASGAPSITD